jgi:hypothetical protein
MLLVLGLAFLPVTGCAGDLDSDRTNDDVDADASSSNGGNSGADGGFGNGAGGSDANGSTAGDNSNGNGTTGTSGDGNAGTTSGTNAGNSGNGSSGATGNATSTTGAETDAAVPSGTPTFVAAGWAGRRAYSTDLGLTWTDVSDAFNGGGGDDEFLLRAVSYGHGQFVAVGWKILTSPDGVTWTARKAPQTQWLGGIQLSTPGRLVATGGFGYSAYSEDAITWKLGGTVGANAPSRSLAFGAGMFVTATDGGKWWSSSDGLAWALLSEGHDDRAVVYCDGSFKAYDTCTSNYVGKLRAQGEGVTIRVKNGKLERATDGQTFTSVLSQGQPIEDVVFGYAP